MKNYIKRLFGLTIESVSVNHEEESSILTYGMTHVGRKRNNNEDAFWIDLSNNLFVVVDGMGGHKAGEIASKIAIESFQELLNDEILINVAEEKENIFNLLSNVLRNTSTKIFQAGEDNPDFTGMGCTTALAWLNECKMHSCHVGDARIYVCDQENINQLGFDHSFVAEAVKEGKMSKEEARLSSIKNQITQALGIQGDIEPEFHEVDLQLGNRILLCSDGLWDMISETEIHKIMFSSNNAKDICENLIEKANIEGGDDNITVIVSIIKEN